MLLPILNLVGYLLNAGVTYGIGILGAFDLPTNADLSLKYQTLITPAGFTFSIWAVIFISQLISLIYQLSNSTTSNNKLVVKGIGYNYLGVCLSQIAWTITFSTEIIWASLVCMLCILAFLSLIVYNQTKISEEDEDYKRNTTTKKSSDFWMLRFPFLIHCGWILAATIVNINVVLVKYDVNASDQYGIGLLCAAAIVGLAVVLLTKKEFVIPLVLAWAMFGIFMELQNPKDSITERFIEKMIQGAKDRALRGTGVIIVGYGYFMYQAFFPPPKDEKITKKEVAVEKKKTTTTTTTTGKNKKRRTKKERKSE